MPEVSEHKVTREITEVVIYPEHAQRTESAEFVKNKERLKADGHDACWVCDAPHRKRNRHPRMHLPDLARAENG